MLTGSHRSERVGACTDCRRYWGKFRAEEIDAEEIADVRKKCRAHFASKKSTEDGRVDFMATDRFEGKKTGYYFGRSAKGMGYHIDYAQMRRLMTLSPGDRCEARYQKVRRYFDGVICAAHV